MTPLDAPTLRIVDANLHRVAEGLRVVEDVCRFALELPGFAAELKTLRHAALAIGDELLAAQLDPISARDAAGDVGRGQQVEPAGGVPDLAALVPRNLERAREAIRVLEEVCRGPRAAASARFQELRYRLYGLEQGIVRASTRSASALRKRLEDARLYLLATGELARGDLIETVAAAIEGGVDVVQLREKSLGCGELLRVARALRELCAREGVLFFVNDRADIARLSMADGAHVGQDDLAVRDVRSVLGREALVGVSTHSREQALRAVEDGADLIGIGPLFSTATKDAGEPIGSPVLREVLAAVELPAFGIGGVTPATIGEAITAGLTRAAVSSAILGAADPRGVARELRERLEAGS